MCTFCLDFDAKLFVFMTWPRAWIHNIKFGPRVDEHLRHEQEGRLPNAMVSL